MNTGVNGVDVRAVPEELLYQSLMNRFYRRRGEVAPPNPSLVTDYDSRNVGLIQKADSLSSTRDKI
jgi:hypothetical protein